MVQRFDARYLASIGDDLKFWKRIDRQRQQQVEIAELEASADNLVANPILYETGIRNSFVAELRIKRVPKKEEASIRRETPLAERNFYDITGRLDVEIRKDLYVDKRLEKPSLKQGAIDLVFSSRIGTCGISQSIKGNSARLVHLS